MNLKDLISILVDADKKNDENKTEVTEDAKKGLADSVEEPKKEEKPVEVDHRDSRIKELEELIKQKDAIISQNSEQIQALKELTSTDQTPEPELSLEEMLLKGDF